MATKRREPVPVGWREWVLLPDLSPTPIKAKIDTGARTSAVHAHALTTFERDGQPWARFEVHPVQRSRSDQVVVETPIHAFRQVRSSTGHTERRPVIKSRVALGPHIYLIELTLTSRDDMGFRLLLGRSALRKRFVVDPGASFLHTPMTDHEGAP